MSCGFLCQLSSIITIIAATAGILYLLISAFKTMIEIIKDIENK